MFNATFDLSNLNGENGFVMDDLAAFELLGTSVSSAGDVNGDGISDVIIGASGASPGGRSAAGSSYVVFGKDTGFTAALELSALTGEDGFVINGIANSDSSGLSVSGAGDVNGDGINDVIVGAPNASPGGRSAAGSSYVVFGKDTGFSAALELSTLDGTNGFAINGIANSDLSGTSVSGANDINGDGISDVIIGAWGADPSGRTFAGSSYVVFGKGTGFSPVLELSTLDGTNGFTINGVANNDQIGMSVSTANDINNDGIDDVIIGAPNADPGGRLSAGSSYVVFGKDTGFSAVLELSNLNGTNGFVINGIGAGANSGFSVSRAGDVNNDGIDDVIIGANSASPDSRFFAGASYVVFGKDTAFNATLELSNLDGTNGFAINGAANDEKSGASVSGENDVNGDGIDDVIIGAPNAVSDAGKVYVVFGKNTDFSPVLELSTLNGTEGFVIIGAPDNSQSGYSVSYVSDLNGDNGADIIIGAPVAAPGNRSLAGTSYVVFGQPPVNPGTTTSTSTSGSINSDTSGRNTVSAASGLESTLDNVLFGLSAGFFAHRGGIVAQSILENNIITTPML